MKRLILHFALAELCRPADRRVGVEVETLFVDKENGEPISFEVSQKIFQQVDFDFAGQVIKSNGLYVRRDFQHGRREWSIFYELGWNNFELISPPVPVQYFDEVAHGTQAVLAKLYETAKRFGAVPLFTHYDGHETIDTLMIPDKRDEIWSKLDGPVLKVLGHIASVHYNIDLCSIEEGMEWMRKLNVFMEERKWPLSETCNVWAQYVNQSHALYEARRFGPPPDETFVGYCQFLAAHKVVMERNDNDMSIVHPGIPFARFTRDDMDVELFLRSIWLNTRLRVRGGRLVLEVRGVPRSSDENISTDWETLRKLLSI